MYQTGSFILKFWSKENAKAALPIVKNIVAHTDGWNNRVMVYGSDITVGEDCYITADDYEGLAMQLCKALAEAGSGYSFLCYAEHLSDDGEIHETFRYRDKALQGYSKHECYAAVDVAEHYWTGYVQNGCLQLDEQDCTDSPQRELCCQNCGEYYGYSEYAPVTRCPYCGNLEEQDTEILMGDLIQEQDDWGDYDFEIPLGVQFPKERISGGKDWLEDCETNDTFNLDPACFPNKNQYDAALMLCKVCAGWYRFETLDEREMQAECLRAVLRSNPGQPMWYYNVWHRDFDWVSALRESNPRYYGLFSDVDTLWELYARLQQRSCIEKAECFTWFVNFFGDALRYDSRKSLSDCYVQNFDNHMEMILYLYPEQIDILTEGVASVSSNGTRYLSRTAAGLIRMGKRNDGIRLYKKVFRMVWEGKSSADDKKAVIDEFLTRLAAGYENEPYLDAELSALLEKQCGQYSDAKWTTKVRMMLNNTQRR